MNWKKEFISFFILLISIVLGAVIITFLFFKGSLEENELKKSGFVACSREIHVDRDDKGSGIEVEKCKQLPSIDFLSERDGKTVITYTFEDGSIRTISSRDMDINLRPDGDVAIEKILDPDEDLEDAIDKKMYVYCSPPKGMDIKAKVRCYSPYKDEFITVDGRWAGNAYSNRDREHLKSIDETKCPKRKYKYKKLDGTETEKELCIHKPTVKYLGLVDEKPTIRVTSKIGHRTLSTDEMDIFLGKNKKPEFIFMNLGDEICTRPFRVEDKINSCKHDQMCYDSVTGEIIKMWVFGNSECKKIIGGG